MPVIKRQKKKPVACQRCHTQKVKCSGERPCAKCRLAGKETECLYAVRDRKIKVNESYLDQVLAENERLKQGLTPTPDTASEHRRSLPEPSHESLPDPILRSSQSHESDVQNPLMGDRAWFHPYDPSCPPIFIGEAACTAFATRLRQFLTGNPETVHVPRTQYTPESVLIDIGIPWPSLPQARLLVRVAFNQISRVYHLLLQRSTLEQLEEIYRTSDFDNHALTCKYFALFALGEVYSAARSGGHVPGTAYYVRAMHLTSILPERPGMANIESLLLLSLFSYFLNRRHSAYILIGNAMRMGLTLGLNHNIPGHQYIDAIQRQHRVRIWWAIYIFDRMFGSKIGYCPQIADEEIHVDMPADVAHAGEDQLTDTQYLTASVHLARIAGEIIEKVYSRKRHRDTFLQREQRLLIALQRWMQDLPEHIRLKGDSSGKHIISLHLQFNQCLILATRPVLLHALVQLSGRHRRTKQDLPQAVVTLSEACIHAARHSHSLLVDEWISGSLPMYGYFYAHYLFSSALVLVISGQLGSIGNNTDIECLETALEILRRMSEYGNLSAMEFYENLERVRLTLQDGSDGDAVAATDPDVSELSHTQDAVGFTTEMAFLEPTMQDFLTRSEMELVNPMSIGEGLDEFPVLWTS